MTSRAAQPQRAAPQAVPSGLRERQKERRRQRILEAARAQFVGRGYEATTIEMIAAAADVSAVTVYNYYGTKAGLLLALAAASDDLLARRITPLIEAPPADLTEAVAAFAGTIRAHALEVLTKLIWRQVIAASIVEGGSRFGAAYARLDHRLARLMARMLEKLAEAGAVDRAADLPALGESLFLLQNARFIQFVSVDGLRDRTVDRDLRNDIRALLALRP
jgi:AcrR family transcriptional regulator